MLPARAVFLPDFSVRMLFSRHLDQNDSDASNDDRGTSEAPSVIQKKIALLGASGVGKTSLVRRFVDSLFDDKYLTTIGEG